MPPKGSRGSDATSVLTNVHPASSSSGDPLARRDVPREHGGAQPEDAVVRDAHRIGFVARRENRRDRAEQLFVVRGHSRSSRRPARSADRTSPYRAESHRRAGASRLSQPSRSPAGAARRADRDAPAGRRRCPRRADRPFAALFIAATSFSVNAATSGSTTMKRLALTQLWPELISRDVAHVLTASSRSASSRTMYGSEPPSSSTVFLNAAPACAATALPAGVLPVSVTARTSG